MFYSIIVVVIIGCNVCIASYRFLLFLYVMSGSIGAYLVALTIIRMSLSDISRLKTNHLWTCFHVDSLVFNAHGE